MSSILADDTIKILGVSSMKQKEIYLEFTHEEAVVMFSVFNAYVQQLNYMQQQVPAVDIVSPEIIFIMEAQDLLCDAADLGIDVLIACDPNLKWCLYNLAILTGTLIFNTKDREHVPSCIIKLLHAVNGWC